MRAPLLILASVVLLTCSKPSQGSLRVQVNLAPGLSSRCARVIARATSQRESSAVLLEGRPSFVVGISQDDETADVLLQARGFSDDACTTLTVPAENSELLPARFSSPTPSVTITLKLRQGAGVDADGDSFFAGIDCDDDEALINPASLESCSNGLDDDCDGTIDCADPDCAARSCGLLGHCTNGVCVAPSEGGLCADGVDNDGDGDIDCADADCPLGTACNDANACTRDDVCGASGCAGAGLTCNQPPGPCFAPTGTCVAGSGCSYPVITGACNDGLACTQNDTCRPDGSCSGTPRSCDPPPNACSGAGTCSEAQGGTCVYPPGSGACDDGDNCTRDDTCDSAGRCSGTRVNCTPPGECFTSSGCSASGGCVFSVRTGSCSGGTCNAAGTCMGQSTAAFPSSPANFLTSQLPTSAGAVVVSCDVSINTQTGAWTTCPGGPAAPAWRVVGSSLLLSFDSLTIPAGVTMRAVGERALIIAVRGAAVIDGTLTASSDGVQGAGSELFCGAGVGEDGRVGGNAQSAGGGGGGGGFGARAGKGSDGAKGGKAGDRGDENGNLLLTPLKGGCRGGDGGRATHGGGRGGGALQLTAGSITVTSNGTVSAQGEGGRGGLANQRMGGGGGGSGGAILLQATELTLSPGSAVVANGGAGGEGSGTGPGGDGENGQRSTARAEPVSLTCGGDGGNGGSRAGAATNAREATCGDSAGGGGGGSAGRIRFDARDDCSVGGGAVISPEPEGSRCR